MEPALGENPARLPRLHNHEPGQDPVHRQAEEIELSSLTPVLITVTVPYCPSASQTCLVRLSSQSYLMESPLGDCLNQIGLEVYLWSTFLDCKLM